MPRKKLPARLWLRKRGGRTTEWIILDSGRQIATGCGAGDERRAQEKLTQYLTTQFRADTGQSDPGKIRIAEVMSLYMRDVAPYTASPELIGYHAVPLLDFFGRDSLAKINGERCRAYARKRGDAVAQSTVRRELTTLQAAINHWHKESPLPAVPVIVKPDEGERRQRYLTRCEAAKLLWACRLLKLPHVARFILLGLYSGTRHSALLALRWYDSSDAGHIDVARAILYRRGSEQGETRKRRPASRLPDRLMVHVRIWARRDLQRGPQTAIIRWKGKSILKEKRAWLRVVEKAGLGRYVTQPDGEKTFETDVTPHVLRHTTATWALQNGMDEWDISGLTGMSLKTLERTYGHHDAEYQVAASKAFRRA